MNQKEKTILNKLVTLYTELYPSRSLFRTNVFSYSPEEIKQIIENITDDAESERKHSVDAIRDEIKNISTIEQVREYITKLNLLNGQYENISDNKPALELTLAEYKYLYHILYSTPVNSKIKKEVLIHHIIKYFDGIDRAQSLKP